MRIYVTIYNDKFQWKFIPYSLLFGVQV